MKITIEDKIEKFFSGFKTKNYKKGELLIQAEEPPAGIFYLSQGQVKVYVISRNGDELVFNIFKQNTFFPMSWAVSETVNRYFYETISEAKVYIAPKDKVVSFIKNNPDVLYDLVKRVYKGTDGLLTRMTYLMAGNAYARLITELIIQAKRFGKNQIDTYTLPMSEKDIAAQAGMTRETVSRELKKLKEKQLVIFNHRVLVIPDLRKLEEELH